MIRIINIILLLLLAIRVDGAVVNFIGFETAEDLTANPIEREASSGTLTIHAVAKRTGNYGLQVNPSTTATGYLSLGTYSATGNQGTFNVATLYCRFYMLADQTPPSGHEECFRVSPATTGTKISVHVNSGGFLSLWDSAGSQLGSDGETALGGGWRLIELKCGTGASADYELKIDGAVELSGTGNLGTSNAGKVFIGKGVNTSSQQMNMFYDDVSLDDAAYPGAGGCQIMQPDGNGNYTAWTGTYADADEIPVDDDATYWTSSSSGDAETAALESYTTAGISGTVRAVKSVAVIRDEGGSSAIQVRLRSGTTDNDTTNNDPGSTYRGRCKVYTTDPADSGAWSLADLNSLEVGVENNAAVAARCTMVCVMVDFSTATASTGLPVFVHHYKEQGSMQ
jgi:hypothetical protein